MTAAGSEIERTHAVALCAVDRVEVYPAGGGTRGMRAWKRVVATDPYLGGHFPDLTIYPGMFLLESLHQAVLACVGTREGVLPRIVGVRSIRCLAALAGGDELTLDGGIRPSAQPDRFRVEARCRRGDGVCAATLVVDFGYPGSCHD
ncbi:MAG: hypothetical protein ACRD0P_23665 [Stackebrandtia sp.]